MGSNHHWKNWVCLTHGRNHYISQSLNSNNKGITTKPSELPSSLPGRRQNCTRIPGKGFHYEHTDTCGKYGAQRIYWSHPSLVSLSESLSLSLSYCRYALEILSFPGMRSFEPRTLAAMADAFDEHLAMVRIADQEGFDIVVLQTGLDKLLVGNINSILVPGCTLIYILAMTHQKPTVPGSWRPSSTCLWRATYGNWTGRMQLWLCSFAWFCDYEIMLNTFDIAQSCKLHPSSYNKPSKMKIKLIVINYSEEGIPHDFDFIGIVPQSRIRYNKPSPAVLPGTARSGDACKKIPSPWRSGSVEALWPSKGLADKQLMKESSTRSQQGSYSQFDALWGCEEENTKNNQLQIYWI